MARGMRRFGLSLLSLMVLSMLFIQFPTPSFGLDVTIQVAPSTLNIQSTGEVVTVHTNIVYSNVVGGTVTLNGIEINWWKADNQGNFVAKFLMQDVKALADTGALQVPGENDLTLVGETIYGETFTGTEKITVIDVQPAGAGRK